MKWLYKALITFFEALKIDIKKPVNQLFVTEILMIRVWERIVAV